MTARSRGVGVRRLGPDTASEVVRFVDDDRAGSVARAIDHLPQREGARIARSFADATPQRPLHTSKLIDEHSAE
jgi:hypothetical protein